MIDSVLLQFFVGGAVMVAASSFANLGTGPVTLQIAALVSTLPLFDMLPVAFTSIPSRASSLALRSAVSNVAVIVGMLLLWQLVSRGVRGGTAVAASLVAWLLTALFLQLGMDRFFPDSGPAAGSKDSKQ